VTSANNKKAFLRCPWCGKRPVPTKRGRLASHVTAGNIKCIGIGQPVDQVRAWNALRERP